MKRTYNYGLFIVCVLFGMGSWLLINGIFSQMPALVLNAPEGWELPSYFSLLVQLANVSPLIYGFLKVHCNLNESTSIIAFMTLGTISMFSLAFTYDRTSIIFGRLHSTYLFVCSFFMSMVGCTSSVLFIPFMNTLPESYLIPYFIGEGISGFLPSVMALVQGVQKSPRCVNVTDVSGNATTVKIYNPPLFSSTLFFLIIGFFMATSASSFLYLLLNPSYRGIKILSAANDFTSNALSTASSSTNNQATDKENTPLSHSTALSKMLLRLLLGIQLIVNLLGNGILPSVESYSCLPYGSDAYHWAVNIGQISSPITFYVSTFLPLRSLRLLSVFTGLCFVCLTYQIATAFLSPNPPFVGSLVGAMIVVAVWVCSSASISYVKLSIATICRNNKQARGLFYYGVVTQLGSAIGSSLSFYVVNYANLLHSSRNYEQC